MLYHHTRIVRNTGWGIVIYALVILLTGCNLDVSPSGEPTPPATQITPSAIELNLPWQPMRYTVDNVCFEYAQSVATQVFTLRSAEDHIRFYDAIDDSQICRRPIERVPVNFNGGFLIIGLWTPASGCTGRHDLLRFRQDDNAKSIEIELKFVAVGTCNYELLVPFWIGLDGAADYDVTVSVE